MAFNPLRERGIPIEQQFRNWSELNVKPYDKNAVHPFSRCRGIVMNGIEVEAVMFSHNMARHTVDPKLKQQLALVRRAEAQQQRAINWLIPGNEFDAGGDHRLRTGRGGPHRLDRAARAGRLSAPGV